jgi:cysteine desulfurase
MMKRIYFDNAATTQLAPEVLEHMLPYLTDYFGNPSSIHAYGRETRLAIENARKSVARILSVHPAEIFFTSGGTESSNTAIQCAVRDLGCSHIITSPVEHHATLHTVSFLEKTAGITISYVHVDADGYISYDHLESLLKEAPGKTLVSLMHANNEIGNMTDLVRVGTLCRSYNAIFHSDTVQTVGHFPINLRNIPVDFISASAHKFHGPKGTGILYINENIRIQPWIHGGGQERNMRAGTENVSGIVGFAKALELATASMEVDHTYILNLRNYLLSQLRLRVPDIAFNGDPEGSSLYTILNAAFPFTPRTELLMMNLDIHHIAVSGGSACTSGAAQESHVIRAVNRYLDRIPIRFSFSKYNTLQEIDTVIAKLQEMV